MPALPLDEAGKYVAGAYVVFVLLLVIYVAIMATKLQRIERELRELARFAEQGRFVGAGDEVAARADQGSQGVGAGPAAPGREAEEAADDEAKPSPGPGHSLSLPGPGEGRADHTEGIADV